MTPASTCVPTEGSARCPTVSATPSAAPGADAAGFGTEWLLVLAIIVAVAAALVFLVLWITTAAALRRSRAEVRGLGTPRARVGPDAPISVPPRTPDAEPVGTIEDLVVLADLADGPATSAQVVRALRRLGVEMIAVAPGDRFDPDRHAIVNAVRATLPGTDGTIAEVVRPGWATPYRIVRPADVSIHRNDAPSARF